MKLLREYLPLTLAGIQRLECPMLAGIWKHEPRGETLGHPKMFGIISFYIVIYILFYNSKVIDIEWINLNTRRVKIC